MRLQLSNPQLSFVKAALTPDNARDLYEEHARKAIHALTGCYPDKLDWHNNRDQWAFPFGIWITAELLTPSAVCTAFRKRLAKAGLTMEDVDTLNKHSSLFDHYNLRITSDSPCRFQCTADYFKRSFLHLIMWAQGMDTGEDFRVVDKWLDNNRHVSSSSAWTATVGEIRINKFKNGRIDCDMKPEHLARIRRAEELYRLNRELTTKARHAVVAERERELEVIRQLRMDASKL